MELLGEVEFVKNQNRRASTWVSQSGLYSSFAVDREYSVQEKVMDDKTGALVNYDIVNYSGNSKEAFFPYRAMADGLSELTGKPAYEYQAYELLISLDLEVYKAERRIIVPAKITLKDLHKVLQSVYSWKDYHLYDFIVLDSKKHKIISRFVPYEEDLEYDEHATLMKEMTLSEIFPKHKQMMYTYDMGDNWVHRIELVKEIENYHEESPYLLEANGQAPPEDVGGVGGFLEFRDIMLDPIDPEYQSTKDWVGYWSLELNRYESNPRVIHIR